jgi:hypothetical protein
MRIIYRDRNKVVVRSYAGFHYVYENERWHRLRNPERQLSRLVINALNRFLGTHY